MIFQFGTFGAEINTGVCSTVAKKKVPKNLADVLFLADMLFGGYDEIGGYANSYT